MSRGRLFIVSGPSGVGKSTVLAELFKLRGNMYFSVSATTRTPRDGEIDGVHYHFRSEEEFRRLIEAGELLEYAQYVGNFYGTPARYVEEAITDGRDAVLDIEIQGRAQVKRARPDAVSVFIAPPSFEELERRLTERGTDTPEKIRGRLARAREEFESAAQYDYIVINDSIEHAAAELNAIFTAEHCRPDERMGAVLGSEI